VLANELKAFILESNEKKAQEIEENMYKVIEENEKIDVTLQFPSKNK
jgi:hypothetical protein